MTVKHRIIDEIAERPMQTEAEIAIAIFGFGSGYQQRVNSGCRFLVEHGYLTRYGRGGRADPFKYTLTAKLYA